MVYRQVLSIVTTSCQSWCLFHNPVLFLGQVPNLMTLPTLQPLELPHRCCCGRQTWWTTSCACSTSCPCSSASVSSPAVWFLSFCQVHFVYFCLELSENLFHPIFASGIPFMYRGLPCIYSSAILASASLLSGGNMALLRIIAIAMIVFMISQSFYPHDRVLESQAWKKAVYAGGKLPPHELPQELRHRKLKSCNLDWYQLSTIKSTWKSFYYWLVD